MNVCKLRHSNRDGGTERERERERERARERGPLCLLSVWFPWQRLNLVKKVDTVGEETKMVCVSA